MTPEDRDFILKQITDRAVTVDDVVGVLIGLEFYYDIRCAVVSREDVEGEFSEAWEFHTGERRKMTDAEWEEFRQEWFWRKGHSEVMWDGVIDAIRWDLADRKLLPHNADVL